MGLGFGDIKWKLKKIQKWLNNSSHSPAVHKQSRMCSACAAISVLTFTTSAVQVLYIKKYGGKRQLWVNKNGGGAKI